MRCCLIAIAYREKQRQKLQYKKMTSMVNGTDVGVKFFNIFLNLEIEPIGL